MIPDPSKSKRCNPCSAIFAGRKKERENRRAEARETAKKDLRSGDAFGSGKKIVKANVKVNR
ncbi:hypothetical protein AKJ65_02850 [candidate division MSBL1 archaeon SCGC-AAA259E19]|uniref:Uncharacterized protein n=1 Tax=candidate division MSBL1 archaeon SCGC-AAA259E19 TaxID=1698264 RepID=A0A133ULD2_9EURY|nr:hypothetical protein AKJ65_02850 [candidate division MSBL1 archaeon SCGC-AAA259E19]